MTIETFQIRAHHLRGLRYSIRDFYEGDTKRYSQKEALVNIQEILTMSSFNAKNYRGIGHSYREDTIGENDRNKFRFYKAIKLQTLDLLTLPDKTPAIVSNRPDSICLSCAIGDHCKLSPGGTVDEDYLTIVSLESWLEQNSLSFKRSDKEIFTYISNLRKFLDIGFISID